MQLIRNIILILAVCLCTQAIRAQIILGGDTPDGPVKIDYSSPKTYEVGGITSSGTAPLDQRLLMFHVGDIIEVPGEKISKTIKNLWNTGLYEDVEITATRVQGDLIFLDVRLEDRARLSAFGFKGITKSEENELREKLGISQGNIVNDNMKITCQNIIRKYYIEKGFYSCEVYVQEIPDEKIKNAINLLFDIHKSKKVKIDKITINGNKGVTDPVLLRSMKETKEKLRFMPFYKADTAIAYLFKHKGYYQSKDIKDHLDNYFADRVKLRIFKPSKFIKENYEKDKVNLINRYNELGYRDAVILHDTFYVKNNKMYIDLDVYEGPQYYFRNITFVGNTVYPTTLLQQLLGISKGDVYNQAVLNKNLTMKEDGEDVASLYMNNGYLFFSANPVETGIYGDSIDIEIRIREGKKATIRSVDVKGNTKTNDNVILRELTTIPGQLFNRSDIIRSQQVLMSMGYFNQEKMDVQPHPNEADGTVDITYVVEETSSDQLSLSAGYGATGFMLTAGITFNNFSTKKLFKKEAWNPIPGGDGQRISLNASVSTKYYQYYSFSFTEPWLGGKKPNALTIGAYYQRQNNTYSRHDSLYAFTSIAGTSISLANKLRWPDDYFHMSHTLSYEYYKVRNWGGFIFANGYSHSFSYIFTLSRNSVNAPIYPREGSDITFSMQLTPPYSLFSDKDYKNATDQEKYKFLEFHKWKFNVSWFTRIVDNLVLNVRMKLGFMGYYNPDIGISPFGRFYLGGDGMSNWSYDGREVIGMRGYDDEALSPNVGGSSVGASIYQKFTAELRYPITLNPSATVYVLAFAEAGKGWIDKHKYNPFDMYKSLGVGVRVYLPMFGLLGFDWGYGFDPVPGLSASASGSHFHISINQSID
ncbi:MAG: outer membrane protein assembly factor BamA [Bacteroidales bacterium]|jgi:outer membrane protein insertion porin family|nr:outer membrane protein assembly factor BamA [Bacteroidales bacterium]